MSYAVVMAYVDANSMPQQRVRLAASLAEKFNATLIGLSAVTIHPLSRLGAKGDWFRNTAALDDHRIEWRAVLDYPADALAHEARGADLVVIGQTKEDSPDSLNPGEALLKIGRPALVVPDGIGFLQAEHVVIGWKDTREARRAIRDALPFLHNAARVTVVEIYESGEEKTAQEHVDDLVRYLARHGITAIPRVIHQQSSDTAELITFAQEEGADVIVTGAYGYSRFGEWIFGGMTRDLLATSSICCLMSH